MHLQLNVFHWHIVDTHSFPVELETAPLNLMAQYGAYDAGKVYKKSEIKDLVRYAMKRGNIEEHNEVPVRSTS